MGSMTISGKVYIYNYQGVKLSKKQLNLLKYIYEKQPIPYFYLCEQKKNLGYRNKIQLDAAINRLKEAGLIDVKAFISIKDKEKVEEVLKEYDHLKYIDLTLREKQILKAMKQIGKDEILASEIAPHVGLAKVTVRCWLTILESKGYVSVKKRLWGYYWSLTPKGQEIINEIEKRNCDIIY